MGMNVETLKENKMSRMTVFSVSIDGFFAEKGRHISLVKR